MTSFSSWGEVNIASSESTASNLQTTWDPVWPDPRIRDVFNFNSYQLYPADYVLCCSILGKTGVDERTKCDYTSACTPVIHFKTMHQGMTPSLRPVLYSDQDRRI